MISSRFAGVAPAEAADGSVSWRAARTATTDRREVRLRGGDGTVRWAALARGREGRAAADEVRWNLTCAAGPGRLGLGSQLRLGLEPDRRGWTDPLATRRPRRAPAASLARTGVGVSWAAGEERTLRVAAGRDAAGAPVGQVLIGAAGWEAGGSRGAEGWAGALGWGGTPGGVAVRAEAAGAPGGALLRAGIGGGGTAGLVLELDGRRGKRRTATLLAAAAVPAGPLRGLQIEGAVRGGGSRARPFTVAWARRVAGWTLRGEVAGRASGGGAAGKATLETALAGTGLASLTFDGGARCRVRFGGAGARSGATVELPPGRPRTGSGFLDLSAGGASRIVARMRWTAGRRAAFDVEWEIPFPGGRPLSTR